MEICPVHYRITRDGVAMLGQGGNEQSGISSDGQTKAFLLKSSSLGKPPYFSATNPAALGRTVQMLDPG